MDEAKRKYLTKIAAKNRDLNAFLLYTGRKTLSYAQLSKVLGISIRGVRNRVERGGAIFINRKKDVK